MSEKSKQDILAEYEKDYLERLSKKGEDSKDVESISEEERTQKIQAAEKLQNESAAQIQAAQKKKDELKYKTLLVGLTASALGFGAEATALAMALTTSLSEFSDELI